jgi:uncharacterized protein YgiM (DUF1202 family)
MHRTALCILAVFAAFGAARAASAETVRVVAARANVRERPDLKSPVIAGVRSGTILQVEGREGNWYRVRLEGPTRRGGRTGYISAALVAPEAAEPSLEGARPLPPAPAPPAASKALSIDHKPVACLVADRYPKMEACFDPASRVSKARLHFRAEGTPHWYNVTMQPEGNCYAGVMPKPARS